VRLRSVRRSTIACAAAAGFAVASLAVNFAVFFAAVGEPYRDLPAYFEAFFSVLAWGAGFGVACFGLAFGACWLALWLSVFSEHGLRRFAGGASGDGAKLDRWGLPHQSVEGRAVVIAVQHAAGCRRRRTAVRIFPVLSGALVVALVNIPMARLAWLACESGFEIYGPDMIVGGGIVRIRPDWIPRGNALAALASVIGCAMLLFPFVRRLAFACRWLATRPLPRRRRCVVCGYPVEGVLRCPECGRIAPGPPFAPMRELPVKT